MNRANFASLLTAKRNTDKQLAEGIEEYLSETRNELFLAIQAAKDINWKPLEDWLTATLAALDAQRVREEEGDAEAR